MVNASAAGFMPYVPFEVSRKERKWEKFHRNVNNRKEDALDTLIDFFDLYIDTLGTDVDISTHQLYKLSYSQTKEEKFMQDIKDHFHNLVLDIGVKKNEEIWNYSNDIRRVLKTIRAGEPEILIPLEDRILTNNFVKDLKYIPKKPDFGRYR